jgi:hypothetical protein
LAIIDTALLPPPLSCAASSCEPAALSHRARNNLTHYTMTRAIRQALLGVGVIVVVFGFCCVHGELANAQPTPLASESTGATVALADQPPTVANPLYALHGVSTQESILVTIDIRTGAYDLIECALFAKHCYASANRQCCHLQNHRNASQLVQRNTRR